MFFVKLHYLVSDEEIRQYSQAHRDHWDFYFQEGRLIAKGPMLVAKGEVLILLGNDLEEIQQMIEKDPLSMAGVCEYAITQFSATKCTSELKSLIFNAP
jgi:uncharacterized protein YciI